MPIAAALKLLIVDDSMIIRKRIAQQIGAPGLPRIDIVGQAADGEQAVMLARQHRPGLITMDLTMPRMDGEACIGEIMSFLPETRILVVSALSDKLTALRAIRRGASGFLHKPFADEQLQQSLCDLIESSTDAP